MADFGGMVLTKLGLNLLAKGQTGAAINITRAAAGAGVWPDATNAEAVTALVDERLTVPIQSMAVQGDGTVKLTVVISNSGLAAGFIFRELGVFATDPDLGEILYAVAYSGDRYDYLPASATTVEKILDIYIVVGGAQNVTATISPGAVLALKSDIEDHAASDPAHPSTKIGFDNTIALLAGTPSRAQTAIEAVVAELTGVESGLAAHEVADPAHAASKISFDNTVAKLEGDPSRVQDALEAIVVRTLEPIAAPSKLYVATTGSDTDNDGLSADSPFATIDHAVALVSSSYALGDYDVIINVAAGTYNEQVILRPISAGTGIVNIVGSGRGVTIIQYSPDLTNTTTTTVTSSKGAGSYRLSSLTIRSPSDGTSTRCMSITSGEISLDDVAFDSGGGQHLVLLVVNFSARVGITSQCYMTAPSCYAFISVDAGGSVTFDGDITISGAATSSVVYVAGCGVFSRNSASLPLINGSVTGYRYNACLNGIIYTVGGGASFIPGSLAGFTSSGGQYV